MDPIVNSDNTRIIYEDDLNEILLADIALKIQLSPSEYDQAVERYEAIEKWLEREDCSLKGKILAFYPQGSMSIHTTISSNRDSQEFDLDLVVELDFPLDSDPEIVLLELFHAVRGKPGSRYHHCTELNSRCVTVHYNNMHMDLCPSVLKMGREERTCQMFHFNSERSEKYTHIRNPWGFSDWFNSLVPDEPEYFDFYESRSLYFAEADAKPLPEQSPLTRKPRKVVAQQLLKRFRNNQYEKRQESGPPSVILAKLGIDAGESYGGLYDELCLQASYIKSELEHFRPEVKNPRCPKEDVFTDRWPKNQDQNNQFQWDMQYFLNRMYDLKLAESLPKKQEVLADLFGEKATLTAFENLRKKYDHLSKEGMIKVEPKTAGIALAATGLASKPFDSSAAVIAPQSHSHAKKE